jgi:mitogen-activated protein kinase 1/3
MISKTKRKNLGINQFEDWEIGNDYTCVRLLGQGSYGEVAEAVMKSTGKKVAIKRMKNIFESDSDCKRILREISIMRRLKHPFCVELIEVLYPSKPMTFDELYVVMSYAESDLKKVIKSSMTIE